MFPFAVSILAHGVKSSRQNTAFCDIISANVQGRCIFLQTAGKEEPRMDFEQLKQECLTCRKCGVGLVKANAVFGYLDNAFPVELPVCPKCGFVYVPEELAVGKVLSVEKVLEDK